MTDFIKKVLRLKGLSYIILALAAGVFLILISGNFGDDAKTSENEDHEDPKDGNFSFEAYEKRLEDRLAQMIDRIEGVSNSSVMVVIDNSYKYDVAEKNGSYTVIRDESGSQSGLVLSEYAPNIRGVAVVCDGGDEPSVQKKIISLLSSVLSLSSGKIFVCSGK